MCPGFTNLQHGFSPLKCHSYHSPLASLIVWFHSKPNGCGYQLPLSRFASLPVALTHHRVSNSLHCRQSGSTLAWCSHAVAKHRDQSQPLRSGEVTLSYLSAVDENSRLHFQFRSNTLSNICTLFLYIIEYYCSYEKSRSRYFNLSTEAVTKFELLGVVLNLMFEGRWKIYLLKLHL